MFKTKNKELNSFIIKYYLYTAFSIMGFIFPFIPIMFDGNGLSATQIALLLMTAKFVQLSTEIPSGAIADKYNRKYVLIASQISGIFIYILWMLYPSFWGYFAGFIFAGIGTSLDSGCKEAFLYDELSKFGRRDLFERVKGRGGTTYFIGIGIAAISSSFLIEYGYNFLMMLTVVTILTSVLILLLIKSAKIKADTNEPENVTTYLETLKEGIKYSFNHKTVLKLMLFLSFASFIEVGLQEYDSIFYNEITNNMKIVPLIGAVLMVALAIGSFCGEYLKKISFKILIFIYFLCALSEILVFSLYSFPVSIILLVTGTCICSGIYVNFQGKTNDFIPSKIRATVLSVKGFIESIGMFICFFLFGSIVDYFGNYRSGFLTLSYLFAIGTFVFLMAFIKDKKLK